MNKYIIIEDSEDENEPNEPNREKPEADAQNSKLQKDFVLNQQETNDEIMILNFGEYNFQRNETKSKNIIQNKISPVEEEAIKKIVENPTQMSKIPVFPEQKLMDMNEDAKKSLNNPISNLKFAGNSQGNQFFSEKKPEMEFEVNEAILLPKKNFNLKFAENSQGKLFSIKNDKKTQMELEKEEIEQEEINYEIKDLCLTINKKLQLIYHISDIHIENNPNTYEEYNYVFRKLEEEILRTDKEKTKLLVITGDILHERTKLYTETIVYTWELLKKLQFLLPIIMIPGNHDMNMRNRQKKDGITGIIFDRITKGMNIHYLLESGLYKYGNVLFCVQSLYDKKTINFQKIKSVNLTKIALYHGIINGSRVDSGFEFSRNKKLEDFNGYDYVLLGDIHSYQCFNNDRNVAYAGSLISQNYGEGESDHGCILWDLEAKNHRFIPIQNIYGYKVLTLKNNDDFHQLPLEEIPKMGKLKIRLIDFKDQSLRLLKDQVSKYIKEKGYNVTLTFEEVNNKKNFDHLRQKHSNNKNQNSEIDVLLQNYLEKKFQEEDERKLLFEFLMETLKNRASKKNKCRVWKILSVKWENMFLYGSKNEVNFEGLKNVIGLVGRNSSGKSLFLEIILYLLYGRDVLKELIKNDLVNKEQANFSGEIILEIDGDIFTIVRKGKLKNRDQKTFEDELHIKRNSKNFGESTKRESQNSINDLIGKYEDVKKINFFLQNENEKILGLKRKERKEYLYRILNINIMDEINQSVKSELKNLENQLAIADSHMTQLLEREISEEKIREDENSLENLKKELKINKLNKKSTIDQIEKFNRELIPQPELPKESKKEIYEKNRKLKKSINNLNCKIGEMTPKLKIANLKQKNKKINKKLQKLQQQKNNDNKAIRTLRSEIDIENKKLDGDLKKMANDVKIIKTILESLKNDQKVDKNQLNKINLDLMTEISQLNDQINSKNSDLKHKIEETEAIQTKIDKLDARNKQNLKNQLSTKGKLNKIRKMKQIKKQNVLSIYSNYSLIQKHHEMEKSVNNNRKVKVGLESSRKNLENIEKEYDNLKQKKFQLKAQIEDSKKVLETTEKYKNDIIFLEGQLKFMKNLLEITSVNGFSYYLLTRHINQIEDKMNEVFGVYFKRTIKIFLEKDAVDFKILNENDKICSSMGGCESLLFELAFRISVARIMKIPLCNTLFIDEHLSVIDFENRYEIRKVFDHIIGYFEKIIVITHDETIKNYVDECMVIKQKGNLSFLNSGEVF